MCKGLSAPSTAIPLVAVGFILIASVFVSGVKANKPKILTVPSADKELILLAVETGWLSATAGHSLSDTTNTVNDIWKKVTGK